MTHQNRPIMMKWSIWVILERLQGLLLTGSSFFQQIVSFPHHTTPRMQHGPIMAGYLPLARSIGENGYGVGVGTGIVPKVFDTGGMEHFRLMAFATLPVPSQGWCQGWHHKCVAEGMEFERSLNGKREL